MPPAALLPYENGAAYQNGNGGGGKLARHNRLATLQSAQPDQAIDEDISSESTLVDRILQVFDTYRTCRQRREIERIWKACIVAFRGMKPQRTDPMKDSMVIKETFRQMYTLWPQYTKQFYSQPQLFRYVPQEAGAEEKMRVATNTVHYQLKRLKQRPNLLQWGFTKFLMGISYIQPQWQTFRTNYMTSLRLQDPDTGYWIDRKTKEVVEMGPVYEFIPPNEIYCHPQAEDVRNSPFAFRHQIVSGAYLMKLIRDGKLSGEAVRQVSMDQLGVSAEGLVDTYSVGPYGVDNFNDALRLESLPNGDVPHELLWCWTNYGTEFAVIDREVLARATLIEGGTEAPDGEIQPGPIPILTKKNYGQIREHWGIPEPYTIIDDQHIVNELATMHRDIAGLTGGPMYKASSNGAQALRNFVAKPGAIMWLNKITDVDIIPPMGFDKANINNIEFWLDRCKQTSGLFDNLAGNAPATGTATAQSELKDAATVRIQDRCLEDIPIEEELWEAAWWLNNRNLRQDVKFSITGEDGNPAYMVGTAKHFDEAICCVQVQTAPMIDGQKPQQWMNLFQMLGKAPFINPQKLAEEWIRSVDPTNSPARFMSNPQTAQVDTMQKLKDWELYGAIPDPQPADNHQAIIPIVQQYMQTPPFQMAEPWKQGVLLRFLQLHMNYMQAMMQQMGAAQAQSPQGPGPGAPPPPINQQASGQFGLPNTGAAQQGAPPPNGPPLPPMPQGPVGAPPQ